MDSEKVNVHRESFKMSERTIGMRTMLLDIQHQSVLIKRRAVNMRVSKMQDIRPLRRSKVSAAVSTKRRKHVGGHLVRTAFVHTSILLMVAIISVPLMPALAEEVEVVQSTPEAAPDAVVQVESEAPPPQGDPTGSVTAEAEAVLADTILTDAVSGSGAAATSSSSEVGAPAAGQTTTVSSQESKKVSSASVSGAEQIDLEVLKAQIRGELEEEMKAEVTNQIKKGCLELGDGSYYCMKDADSISFVVGTASADSSDQAAADAGVETDGGETGITTEILDAPSVAPGIPDDGSHVANEDAGLTVGATRADMKVVASPTVTSFTTTPAKPVSRAIATNRFFSAKDAEGDDEIYFNSGSERIQVTNNTRDDRFPSSDIFGTRAVWQTLIDSVWQIMMYDAESGKVEQVTSTNFNNMNPSIYKDTIVWQAWVNNNWEIFIAQRRAQYIAESTVSSNTATSTASSTEQSLVTSTSTPITQQYCGSNRSNCWKIEQITDNSWHDLFPRVAMGLVTWQSYEEGTWSVLVYDLETRSTSIVSEGDKKYENPRFSLVWDGRDDVGDVSVYGYDLSSGAVEDLGGDNKDKPIEMPDAPLKNEVPLPARSEVSTSIASGKPNPNPDKDDDSSGNNSSGDGSDPDIGNAGTSTTQSVLEPVPEAPSSVEPEVEERVEQTEEQQQEESLELSQDSQQIVPQESESEPTLSPELHFVYTPGDTPLEVETSSPKQVVVDPDLTPEASLDVSAEPEELVTDPAKSEPIRPVEVSAPSLAPALGTEVTEATE